MENLAVWREISIVLTSYWKLEEHRPLTAVKLKPLLVLLYDDLL